MDLITHLLSTISEVPELETLNMLNGSNLLTNKNYTELLTLKILSFICLSKNGVTDMILKKYSILENLIPMPNIFYVMDLEKTPTVLINTAVIKNGMFLITTIIWDSTF